MPDWKSPQTYHNLRACISKRGYQQKALGYSFLRYLPCEKGPPLLEYARPALNYRDLREFRANANQNTHDGLENPPCLQLFAACYPMIYRSIWVLPTRLF
ncbi:MAG: hypothetical protein AAF353_05590, partial [Pseudomonadota bacterium]